MEKYLKVLNAEQRNAVTTDSQHVRIIAGAGSGKTRVLTTRIVYIIENWGIDGRKILAITFTNKATNEMRSRINELLPEEAAKIHISTIHSFCVMVLRQEIKRMGYPTNFTILDSDDQKSIIKEAMKYLNIDSKKYNSSGLLEYIANNKCAEIDGEEAAKRAYNCFEKDKAEIYGYYLERQKQLYALDFDDLLLWTVRLFRTFHDAREKWQKKYQFILVDEFQDIDNIQYELIRLLTTPNTYLYVVGDPDQTIYTWRGANINIIMNFEQDFKPCETIVLERNYRSTQMILKAANSLIRYNKNRVEKNLFTANEQGSKISRFKAPTEDDEAIYVARKILELTVHGDYGFDDVAVLYRSNYLSRSFEKALIDYKIPYVIYGGVRFYERQEIKDCLSYLRMLVQQDDLSFKRIVNVPKRGIGSKTVDGILEQARKHRLSMFEEARTADLPARVRKTLKDLTDQIEEWKERSREMKLEQVLQMILDESGYREMLESSEDPRDEDRLENIKELINDLHQYQKNMPEATLEDYLQMVTLYTDIQTNRGGMFVSLMTVHSAKGLEFKNVFVVGLSEGIFPSDKSMQEGIKGLEEERRLAYVAFTRAREHLYLTESMGYSYTTGGNKFSSRFLDEVDSEFILSEGVKIAESRSVVVSNGSEARIVRKRKPLDVKPGDIMVHDDFGEGVVISLNGNFGDIAFAYPYMTKTLSLNFPKLHKKEKKDE